jgi:hypothetical protein
VLAVLRRRFDATLDDQASAQVINAIYRRKCEAGRRELIDAGFILVTAKGDAIARLVVGPFNSRVADTGVAV